MSGAAAVKEDFGDRWNPLLVKELRQTLRSKAFGILFLSVHGVAATLVTSVLTFQHSSAANHYVVSTLTLLMAFATLGVVPILAFQSFAQEWDDNTHDMLVLTDLGPGRLALGKLLGPACLGWLIVVSFAPYLALSVLLEGADLVFLGTLVGGIALAIPLLVAVAMAAAGVAQTRQMRNGVLGVFTIALLMLFFPLMPLLLGRELTAAAVRTSEFWTVLASLGLSAMVLGIQCFLGARAHLAHPEEAPTLAVRAFTLAAAFVLPIAISGIVRLAGLPLPGSSAQAFWVFLLLFPSLAIFATERETIGRVVQRRIAKSFAARLAHPLFPGGGRGLLLMIGVAAVAWGASYGSSLLFGAVHPHAGFEEAMRMRFVLLVLYAFLFTAPLSFLTWKAGHLRGVRWMARVAILLSPFFAILGGMLVGLMLDDGAMQEGEHWMNPFLTINEDDVEELWKPVRVLSVVAAAIALVSLPRWWLGWRDVHGKPAPERARGA